MWGMGKIIMIPIYEIKSSSVVSSFENRAAQGGAPSKTVGLGSNANFLEIFNIFWVERQ